MKLVVISKLLINRGWRLADKTSQMQQLSPADQCRTERLIVLPTKSSTLVPAGTLEAIMRRTGQMKSTSPWPDSLSIQNVLHIVVEKAADVFWGRLEVKGLLLVVRGTSTDDLDTQVRTILAQLIVDLVEDPSQFIESLRFEHCYDLAEVWTLLRQVRGSYVADLSGVDASLVNQFISGSAFPTAEQTCQLQRSIRELGNQLLRLAC